MIILVVINFQINYFGPLLSHVAGKKEIDIDNGYNQI